MKNDLYYSSSLESSDILLYVSGTLDFKNFSPAFQTGTSNPPNMINVAPRYSRSRGELLKITENV